MAASIHQSVDRADPLEELSAPFLLRCGAVMIDYIIFLILPVLGLLSERMFSGGLDIAETATLWFLACVISVVNVIVLPLFLRQSIGKMLAGLRIISAKGEPAGRGSILFRQTIGYLLTIATGGIGFFVCIFTPRSRALHDYLAGTRVVRAARREVRS